MAPNLFQKLTYSSEDWHIMELALYQASAILRRPAKTHHHSERLARTIMSLFDRGLRDPSFIAVGAADRENSLADMQRLRVLPALTIQESTIDARARDTLLGVPLKQAFHTRH